MFSVTKVQDTISERLFDQGQYRLASNRIVAQLTLTKGNNGNDRRLYYYNKLSMAQFRLNNFDSAMICARQALKLSSGSKDSTLISDAWKMMSYSFNRLGKLDSAIYFTIKLLKYSKRAGDDHQYRNASVSMATILMQNQRTAEALKYFLEANKINKKMNDTGYFAIGYFNIGLVHLKLKQYDSCLYYMKEALGNLQNGTKPDLLCMTYGTISDCYLAMGKKEESKRYNILAIDVAKQLGSYQFLAMAYCNLIEGCLNQRDFSSAVKYGFSADSLLKKEPFPVQQVKLDSMMYVAFSNLSKPAEALAWYELFVKIKNQVLNENQKALLNRMMVEFKVKEKNLMIEKQESDIHSKTRQVQLLILLLVISVLFTSGLIKQNIKLRNSRESLYRKEKYLDRQMTSNVLLKTSMVPETDIFTKHSQAVFEATPSGEQADVDPGLLDDLYVRIISVLEKKKLYLDPEINVKTLLNLLGTNKTYIYQAINLNSSENFRSLINRYRINEAKRIIEICVASSSDLDVTTISSRSGFNSSVSFFRVFKHYTGLTPKEYAIENRKEARKNSKEMAEMNGVREDEI
ncbi:MAG: helix-turn-helix domain-containing protein [Bacteroidota bacterium]